MNREMALGFFSFLIAATAPACVGVEEQPDPLEGGMSEPEAQEQELTASPGPGICGCRDGDDRDCREVRRKQWGCSYGWPCNYVVYKPDCSAANACPLTTWNGCVLQSQVCYDTGRTCAGHCSDGAQCSIVYEPAPIEPILESEADAEPDGEI